MQGIVVSGHLRLTAVRGHRDGSDSGSNDSSLGVLDAAGFEQVATLPEFWREPQGQETLIA
jgi:hypothetical protein